MSKILKGALIGLCLFMFNVSASYSQVPERAGCKSLEDAKKQEDEYRFNAPRLLKEDL